MKIIYEPTSKGLAHLVFNASFLKIIASLYKEDNLYFFGEEEHLEHIKSNIEEVDNLILKKIKVNDLSQKLKALVGEFVNLMKIKIFDIKNNSNELIITNSHAHTLLFTKFLFSKKKITFILHGSIEELLKDKNFLQLGFYNKLALEYKNKKNNFRYIVLGDSIKENLEEIIPSIKNNLYSIEHPYDFKDTSHNDNLNVKKNINIGTIGNVAPEKRSESLFEIENYLNENGIENIKLFHVGKFDGIDIPENSKVKIPGSKRMLPRIDYEEYINNLDYILFFYPSDTYRLTASGAIFDAISYNKPVIVIENDYFKYIFKICGDIGYLCKDIDEMKNILNMVHKNHLPEHYNEIVNNIKESKKLFSYTEIAKDVRRRGIW